MRAKAGGTSTIGLAATAAAAAGVPAAPGCPDGAVPGPHHREGSSAEERWVTDAHTTLVALLRSQTAGVLPADPGHADPAEVADTRVCRVRAVANGAGWPLGQGVAA